MTDTVLPPDQAARTRLQSEFATNLLVEAGAGSGKTESLAARMAAGIALGHYEVDHLAAVTFTRKAAAELRARFLLKLEARRGSAASDEERQRVQAAIDGIERFFAGTIHSFCARLLRERPVDARMAPGFEELDDIADAHARRRAWHAYIAQGRANAALLDVLESGLKPKELDLAFRIVCEHGDVTFPADTFEMPDVGPIWQALDTFWEQLRAILPQPIDPETTCEIQKFSRTYPGMRRGARTHRVADLAELLHEWGRAKKITRKWWGTGQSRGRNPGADAANALVEPFMEGIVVPFLGIWRAHLYAQVMRALLEARAFYAADRRQRNLVNFGDLLIEATRLVRDVPHVRRALQRKFRHVFVDEFQDTDPIQAELFLWLASDADMPAGANAWTAPLRPGALFLVGDPKQSIYRFRRADIEVYESVRRRLLESGGDVVSLTANFRSRPAICDFVNGMCANAFPPVATPEAPAYEPLRAHKPERSDEPAVQRLLVDPVPGERFPISEARAVAKLIADEIAAGQGAPGDYLVLTRARTQLGRFAEALQERLVPVEVSGASLFTSSAYVAALVDVLACLADPSNGVSLLRVLRGPILGATDEALFAYREAGGRFDLYGAGDVDDGVGRAIGILRRWQQQSRRLPVGALLDVILDESGWLAHAAAHPGGGEAGALLQAADRARSLASSGAGLHEIATSLIAVDDVSTDIEALPLEPGRSDVVRVMNIHRAKGLEARVVLLVDAHGWHNFSPEVHVTREAGVATGVLAISREVKNSHARMLLAQPETWPALAAREQQFLAAEVTRLQYVAATRAQERLVVTRTRGDSKDDKAWPLIAAALSGVPEVRWPTVPASRAERVPAATLLDLLDAPEIDPAATRAARLARIEAARQPSADVSSVTEEVRLSASALRAATIDPGESAADVPDATDVLVPDTSSHRADVGRHWGALIHGLLEHAMRAPSASDEDLARLARWLTIEHPELRPHVDAAIALVRGVAAAPFWTEARASGQVHVEVPFTRVASDADRVALGMAPSPQPLILRGVIDLVHRAADGWRVIDYKTDQARAVDLGAKYAAQVRVYAHAWGEASASPVATAVYAVRDGVLVPVAT